MGRAILLESFDAILPAEDPALQTKETAELGYEDGFRTGREAGLAEARAEQAQLHADIVRGFADLTFAHAEARAEIMSALRPLFTVVIETILPKAAEASLAPYIAETLLEAAEEDTRAPIAILVSPDAVEEISRIAQQQAGNPVTVDGNPGLGPAEVLIRHADRETILDLDRLVADMQRALSALFDQDTRRPRHG